MVVAGEEVGTDDEDDEGGAAPVVTTTPMFFASPLLPRHRGRQLMPVAGWPGWDSIQTQLFAEQKRHWDLINRRSEKGFRWCPYDVSMPPKPLLLGDAVERCDRVNNLLSEHSLALLLTPVFDLKVVMTPHFSS